MRTSRCEAGCFLDPSADDVPPAAPRRAMRRCCTRCHIWHAIVLQFAGIDELKRFVSPPENAGQSDALRRVDRTTKQMTQTQIDARTTTKGACARPTGTIPCSHWPPRRTLAYVSERSTFHPGDRTSRSSPDPRATHQGELDDLGGHALDRLADRRIGRAAIGVEGTIARIDEHGIRGRPSAQRMGD